MTPAPRPPLQAPMEGPEGETYSPISNPFAPRPAARTPQGLALAGLKSLVAGEAGAPPASPEMAAKASAAAKAASPQEPGSGDSWRLRASAEPQAEGEQASLGGSRTLAWCQLWKPALEAVPLCMHARPVWCHFALPCRCPPVSVPPPASCQQTPRLAGTSNERGVASAKKWLAGQARSPAGAKIAAASSASPVERSVLP